MFKGILFTPSYWKDLAVYTCCHFSTADPVFVEHTATHSLICTPTAHVKNGPSCFLIWTMYKTELLVDIQINSILLSHILWLYKEEFLYKEILFCLFDSNINKQTVISKRLWQEVRTAVFSLYFQRFRRNRLSPKCRLCVFDRNLCLLAVYLQLLHFLWDIVSKVLQQLLTATVHLNPFLYLFLMMCVVGGNTSSHIYNALLTDTQL